MSIFRKKRGIWNPIVIGDQWALNVITIYFTVFSWIAVKNTGIDKSDLMNVGTFKKTTKKNKYSYPSNFKVYDICTKRKIKLRKQQQKLHIRLMVKHFKKHETWCMLKKELHDCTLYMHLIRATLVFHQRIKKCYSNF